MFFTMYLQVVAVEYFPYNFIIDISSKYFQHLNVDSANELIPPMEFLLRFWSLRTDFLSA